MQQNFMAQKDISWYCGYVKILVVLISKQKHVIITDWVLLLLLLHALPRRYPSLRQNGVFPVVWYFLLCATCVKGNSGPLGSDSTDIVQNSYVRSLLLSMKGSRFIYVFDVYEELSKDLRRKSEVRASSYICSCCEGVADLYVNYVLTLGKWL